MRALFALVATALLMPAHAQVNSLIDGPNNANRDLLRRDFTLQHYNSSRVSPQGAYFALETDGTGWYFSQLAAFGGLTSAAYYGYESTGEAAWFSGVGPAMSLPQRQLPRNWVEGFGTFDFSLNSGVGGSCITCPHVPPQVGPAGRTAQVQIVSPAQLRVTVDGTELPRITHADPLLGGGVADALKASAWARQSRFRGFRDTVEASHCHVRFVEVAAPVSRVIAEPGVPAWAIPSAAARWLRIETGNCLRSGGFTQPEGPMPALPASPGVYQLGQQAIRYLFVEPASPDTGTVIFIPREPGAWGSQDRFPQSSELLPDGAVRLLAQGEATRIYMQSASELRGFGARYYDSDIVQREERFVQITQ